MCPPFCQVQYQASEVKWRAAVEERDWEASKMAKILGRIKNEAEGTLELLWKEIDPKDLERGDHIYCHRRYGTYSHHGQ